MTNIFDAIGDRNLSTALEILTKTPEDVNAWNNEDTPLMIAVAIKDDALINLCLEIPCLNWNARNFLKQTLLVQAVQAGNTKLVMRLLIEPKFARTLQNHTNTEKFELLYCAIASNHEAIVPLLCAQFPSAIFQRNEIDCTPLHSLGKEKVNKRSMKILDYFLSQPNIERNLEIKNLNNILFNVYQGTSYSPIIPVILNYYLHHSTPEHDEANKQHLENYFESAFCTYVVEADSYIESKFDRYHIVAIVLFYYQKKFIHLNIFYRQLLKDLLSGYRESSQRAYYNRVAYLSHFISALQVPHLKRFILKDEIHRLIRERFNLSALRQNTPVVTLAQAIWYQWFFIQEDWKDGHHPKRKMLMLWNIANVTTSTYDKGGPLQRLPQELRDNILEYLIQTMIAPTASRLLVPHTPDQQHKAFYLLLKGFTSWHTSTSIFTAEQVYGKTRLVLTPATLTKESLKEEKNTINAYLKKTTSQQLQLFDIPTP